MTLQKYIIGFAVSFLLTLAAYFLVINNTVGGITLLLLLGGLALAQMIVQLIYFLHIGEEARPRYKLASFLFMAGVLALIVVGSIWIMNNLNANMMHMSPDQKNDYMKTQYDKGF